MMTRPLFVGEALHSNHDSACYVDPRDGNVCSRGHKARKDVLRYISDLEAAVDDANYMEQLFIDMADDAGALPEHGYMREDGQMFWATGYPKEETDGQTEDAGRPEGGEVAAVDLAGVPAAVRPDAPVKPAESR